MNDQCLEPEFIFMIWFSVGFIYFIGLIADFKNKFSSYFSFMVTCYYTSDFLTNRSPCNFFILEYPIPTISNIHIKSTKSKFRFKHKNTYTYHLINGID